MRADGVRGLFRGLPALLARDIPFNALFFGCYDAYCKLLLWLPLPWRASERKSDLSGVEIAVSVRAVVLPLRA